MGKLRDEGMVVGFKAVERARQLLLVWQEPEVYSPDSWWRASDGRRSTHDLTHIDGGDVNSVSKEHVTLGRMKPHVCVCVCVCVYQGKSLSLSLSVSVCEPGKVCVRVCVCRPG
jgi:hypothetical protein